MTFPECRCAYGPLCTCQAQDRWVAAKIAYTRPSLAVIVLWLIVLGQAVELGRYFMVALAGVGALVELPGWWRYWRSRP